MLTRVARGDAGHHLSRRALASYERLELPWLCPAVTQTLQYQRRHGIASAAQSPARAPPRRARSPGPPPSRLHTQSRHQAKEPATQFATPDEFVPFDATVPASHGLGSIADANLSSLLKPFDPSNILMLPDTNAEQPSLEFSRRRGGNIGGGDLSEMHQNLYACIHVGRHERAATLIRRLEDIYIPSAPELLDAHNQYLLGLMESLLRQPSQSGLIAIQKWFEMDIRGKKITPDSTTISVLVKAAMSVLEGPKLDRTVRRYLYIARGLGPHIEEGTLGSPLFSDSEWLKLMQLSSHRDSKIEEMHAVDAVVQPEALKPETILQPASASAPTPQVITPAEQKGLGLATLKRSLDSLTALEHGLYNGDRGLSQEQLRGLQERLEQDVAEAALARWREEAELTSALRSSGSVSPQKLGAYMWEWLQELVTLVKADLKFSDTAASDSNLGPEQQDLITISPYLRAIPLDRLAALALVQFTSAIADRKKLRTESQVKNSGIPLTNLARDIGKAAQLEIFASMVKTEQEKALKYSRPQDRTKRLLYLTRRKRTSLNIKPSSIHSVDANELPTAINARSWSNVLIVKIGAYLTSQILKVARLPVRRIDPVTGKRVTQMQRVASHGLLWHKGKSIGQITIHEELLTRLRNEPVASLIAKHLPMLVEPKQWTDLKKGGYLTQQVHAVRFRDTSSAQEKYVNAAIRKGDMAQVFKGLDVISKTPWRINDDVFKVMTEVWNTGEGLGGLAPRDPDAKPPPEPSADASRNERLHWLRIVRDLENERAGYHSQRCYQNFQLEVARAFLGQTFYCPHNLDFRGRAYPIPPYFNHMGADHCRGLISFSEGKPLGTTGLKWLKIHLANVYGFDKASLSDRELFADEHVADVYDSALNPVGGKRWWLTAEDPWQCLAACMELRNALDSAVPAEYISHLPVHQDGTCNGLQHYAALGGDVIGAKQVNLEPGDQPADIYSAVAEMVREAVKKDAQEGNQDAQYLMGKITRKVVKQTVMTNVYGVTAYGAREQVRSQLKEILPRSTMENPIQYGLLAGYIVTKIFKALSTMFSGAHAIQSWLGDCADRISEAITPDQLDRLEKQRQAVQNSKSKYKVKAKLHGEDASFISAVVWTTPLGMPVVQPYRDPKPKRIKTSLQTVLITADGTTDAVSKRRQLQGFPPNFIHSLDATHMLLSAIKCDEIGLTFASVHDSFWTHAGDVPVMNRILRDAFVAMHSEQIIDRLREEFIARYKGCIYRATIRRQSPLGRQIVKWRLKHAEQERQNRSEKSSQPVNAQLSELFLERERSQLLQSEDPEEQQRGREMITPASLYEDYLGRTPEKQETSILESTHLGAAFQRAPSDTISHNETASMDSADKETVKTDNASDTSNKHYTSDKVRFWLPLTFPATPAKGDFDVTRLKDSQYFFS